MAGTGESPTGSLDQTEEMEMEMEQPTQGQEGDAGDEWDTDLEEDLAKGRQNRSRAEVYLRACRQTGAVPLSPFLRNEAHLNLNHYRVGPREAKALAIALSTDSVVTTLDLEGNVFGTEGVHYLMEMLQTNLSIKSLSLSNNKLQLEEAKLVSQKLDENISVKSMKLSGNDFDDSAGKYLADALQHDTVLKELDLSHNKIGKAGGEHLGHMLALNKGIEVLNLNWNHLGGGGVAFCAGLMKNSTLRQLQLSHNSLGLAEAESLGRVLRQNRTLVMLDLSGNCFNDQALVLFCSGLACNCTLRVLDLCYNPMSRTGALTLLKTVTDNMKSAMEDINISTMFVHEEFVELLEEARKRRPALRVQYQVMDSVTKNLSALQHFQKFLKERNQTIMDFFQALDEDETMTVSTSAFRSAVKEANVPLDEHQVEWLIAKYDKNGTAAINYSHFAELS